MRLLATYNKALFGLLCVCDEDDCNPVNIYLGHRIRQGRSLVYGGYMFCMNVLFGDDEIVFVCSYHCLLL